MNFNKIRNSYIILLISLILNAISAFSTERTGITIDTVISFTAGKGQNVGQEGIYYPNNIFGIPNRFSSDKVPETSPYDILSLGMGGEIIVSFKNHKIINGEGVDFIIFENSFINPVNKKYFAEPAIVSVSYDGLEYFEFPYNYETLNGCAGINPTYGDKNPFDFPSSGGDGFDLDLIGINEIKYIKIKDITESVYKNKDHTYFDAILSGFDLDALVGLNYIRNNDNIHENSKLSVSLKNNIVTVFSSNYQNNENFKIDDIIDIKIYDILGSEVLTSLAKNNENTIEINGVFPHIIFVNILFDNGIYFSYKLTN